MNRMIERIVEMLDYALEDSSDELLLRFEIEGSIWEEDEEEDPFFQYPPTLSDPCPLVGEEFSTDPDFGGEYMDKIQLKELRDMLKAATK